MQSQSGADKKDTPSNIPLQDLRALVHFAAQGDYDFVLKRCADEVIFQQLQSSEIIPFEELRKILVTSFLEKDKTKFFNYLYLANKLKMYSGNLTLSEYIYFLIKNNADLAEIESWLQMSMAYGENVNFFKEYKSLDSGITQILNQAAFRNLKIASLLVSYRCWVGGKGFELTENGVRIPPSEFFKNDITDIFHAFSLLPKNFPLVQLMEHFSKQKKLTPELFNYVSSLTNRRQLVDSLEEIESDPRIADLVWGAIVRYRHAIQNYWQTTNEPRETLSLLLNSHPQRIIEDYYLDLKSDLILERKLADPTLLMQLCVAPHLDAGSDKKPIQSAISLDRKDDAKSAAPSLDRKDEVNLDWQKLKEAMLKDIDNFLTETKSTSANLFQGNDDKEFWRQGIIQLKDTSVMDNMLTFYIRDVVISNFLQRSVNFKETAALLKPFVKQHLASHNPEFDISLIEKYPTMFGNLCFDVIKKSHKNLLERSEKDMRLPSKGSSP